MTSSPWANISKEDARDLKSLLTEECACALRRERQWWPDEWTEDSALGYEDYDDMKLPSSVFNQLKTQKSRKYIKEDKHEKDEVDRGAVDTKSKLLLVRLVKNKVLRKVNGIIGTGKESIILHAIVNSNFYKNWRKDCIVKIFKVSLNDFKQRDRYIKEDYRFKERFSKPQNSRTIINMWAEKEMQNLQKMKACGIKCPDVITLKQHVLVMSFIGEGSVPAPKLKYAQLQQYELRYVYDEIIKMMKQMYKVANLVHADLSEYNILWHYRQVYFIDVAQSVEVSHPNALEFLLRDCNNIRNYFTRCGLKVQSTEKIFKYVSGLDATSILNQVNGR